MDNYEKKIRVAVENAGSGKRVVLTKGLKIKTMKTDLIIKFKLKQHPNITNVFLY
ncbi:MAG: hypothetical protein GY714_09670 [Desulfobacterales bacterium]|nr:hypothetical protein [Desulfobacterales bacterium]